MLRIIKSKLFWVFILALFLRLYRLETFPFGLHVDEIKVGWNAYSIYKTGHDDNGNYLSLYYNSFGDFRPTGIFYLTIPSLILFGKSIFAIRFVSSLFGALTVIPIYLLSKKLIRGNNHYIASILMAISPWHIMVSRATSEVVISMFFALLALYFYTRSAESKRIKYLTLTFLMFLFAYLLYHSIRLLAPIFVFVLFLYSDKSRFAKIGLIGTVFLSFIFLTTQGSIARLNQVSIKKDLDYQYELERLTNESPNRKVFKILNNEKIIYLKRFVYQYGSYFSSDFLIGNSARPSRYTTPGTGLMGYVEFILFITGLIIIVNNKKTRPILLLLLASPLPAAFTIEDSPNLHRSLYMLPFIVIITSYALSKLKKIRLIIYLLIFLNFIYFSYLYIYHSYNHKPFIKNYSMDSPTYRNVGAIELAQKIDSYTNKFDRVIISNFPDSIYPWYSFFTNKEPDAINKNGFKNITFTKDKCASDNSFENYPDENILTIDSWECGYESKIKDGLPVKIYEKIKRPDGSEVYILLSRKYTK